MNSKLKGFLQEIENPARIVDMMVGLILAGFAVGMLYTLLSTVTASILAILGFFFVIARSILIFIEANKRP